MVKDTSNDTYYIGTDWDSLGCFGSYCITRSSADGIETIEIEILEADSKSEFDSMIIALRASLDYIGNVFIISER